MEQNHKDVFKVKTENKKKNSFLIKKNTSFVSSKSHKDTNFHDGRVNNEKKTMFFVSKMISALNF